MMEQIYWDYDLQDILELNLPYARTFMMIWRLNDD